MKRLLTGIKTLTGKTANDIACNSRLGVQKLKNHGKIRTAQEIGEVATVNVDLSSLMQNDLVITEKKSKSKKIEKKIALKLKNETIKANSMNNGYGVKSNKDLFSKGSTDKVDVGSLILFEDNHLLVLNKVAGVLTQGDKSESLLMMIYICIHVYINV